MVAAKSACPVCKPPCNRRNSRGRQPAKRGGNDGAEGNDDHGNDGAEGNDDHDGKDGDGNEEAMMVVKAMMIMMDGWRIGWRLEMAMLKR